MYGRPARCWRTRGPAAVLRRQRVVSVAIGSAACSATAFIVAVIGATDLVALLHPDAIPGHTTPELVRLARVMMGLSFGLGIYALFGCIGVSGWIRSFAIGYVTTAIGAIGVICVSIIISH